MKNFLILLIIKFLNEKNFYTLIIGLNPSQGADHQDYGTKFTKKNQIVECIQQM